MKTSHAIYLKNHWTKHIGLSVLILMHFTHRVQNGHNFEQILEFLKTFLKMLRCSLHSLAAWRGLHNPILVITQNEQEVGTTCYWFQIYFYTSNIMSREIEVRHFWNPTISELCTTWLMHQSCILATRDLFLKLTFI